MKTFKRIMWFILWIFIGTLIGYIVFTYKKI